VVAGSPAEKAGFEAGDVILKFDDRNVDASSDLPPIVGRTAIGKKSKAEIMRNNKMMTLSVVVEELPEDEQVASGSTPRAGQFYDNRLALEVTDLTAEQQAELGPNQGGVTVRKIESGPAAEAGLAPGDLILSINNEKITDAKQFVELAKNLPTNKAIPVLVQRSGASQFLALKIPE
jgi:serine protease Do